MSPRRSNLGKIPLRHEFLLKELSRLQKLHFPLKDYMDGSQSSGPTFKSSKVDPAFSTRNLWELSRKSKLPHRSDSSLEAVEPYP